MALGNPYPILLVCCIYVAVFGVNAVRELSSEDLKNIGESTNQDFIAVFFDKLSIRQAHPKFTKEFDKSSDILESFGVELGKVNCAEQSIPQCSNKERNIYVYRKGDPNPSEEIDVSHLFNEDSIVANLLQFVLNDFYHYVPDENSLNAVLAEGQGEKDVVLCYVRGLGMKEHRHFLELVHYSKNEAHFGITTDVEFMKKIGLSTNQKAAVHLFHCKQTTNTQDKCPSTKFTGKVEKIPLIRFLRSQNLPNYVILPSNRTTVFDTLLPPVNKLFIFTDKLAELDTKEIEQMAVDFQGAIGMIIVDVNDQKDMLASFGLSQDNNFPTAAFVAPKGGGVNMTYIELFPENIAAFTPHNLKHFVKPLIDNPSAEHKRIAEASSLQKLTYASYKDAMKSLDTNYLLALDFLMVVFCQEDHEPCEEFSKTLRRIVRTFDRGGEGRITFAYVKTSQRKKTFEGEKFPVVHLHLTKSSDDFVQYTSELEYEAMMEFITDNTKIKRPVSLPPSLSDEAPILFPYTNEEKEDSEEYIEELEDEEESEGETSESGEESVDEADLPEEETEDDEVSAAVLKAKPTVVPESLVPALTDKTFDVIKKENDLLVVDFFQPWDARCKAFLQPYVNAATHISNLDVGNFAIKLARVNCFDWTDVCQTNNITVYPTIKMYRKDSGEITYRGPLDSDHLAKAVLLLQHNLPLTLDNKETVEMFFDGRFPSLAKTATDIAVVGMFLDKSEKEFEAFEAAAKSLRGKFLMGYVTSATAKTLSTKYGLKLPAIMAYKRNDPFQSVDVFERKFTSQAIVDFVLKGNLPSFGELTPFNLPTYLTYKKPLLIVFRADSADSVITPVMTRLARDRSLPSVFLCWMPVYSTTDVNAEILKSYTGTSESLPALVLVNHEKGTVHLFKNDVTKQAVKGWVESILNGKEQPTRLFSDGEWKPRLEGYDFLRMLDEEEEEKERQRLKKKKLERALKETDNLDEEEPDWSPPEANVVEERDRKTNRLRRPEIRVTRRDEL
ncbi:uncharacterized protein LOC111341974 [Stylophora pistillata]|uniref:uncharacterized protein LOC111341974 n=1 Tax=Stylophora pistillata TaxID=50429 RepID=UPI000C04E70F|nr:uncharacterized protein LOC111341974 [Stylophora pistillata]